MANTKFKTLNIGGKKTPDKEEIDRDAILEKVYSEFSSNQKNFQKFPLEAFPLPFQQIFKTASENNLPVPYVATTCLIVAAGLIGNSYKINLTNLWIEPAILWGIIVGPSSKLKTPAMKFGTSVVYDIEKEKQEEYDENLEYWRGEMAMKKKGEPDPPKPFRESVYLDSATVEAVRRRMLSYPKGLVLIKDELMGWVGSFNQYSKGGEEQFWLSAFNNTNGSVQRNDDEKSFFVSNLCISAIGGIQNAVLKKLASGNRDDNGFLYRFLFAFPEDNKTPKISLKNKPSIEFITVYKKILRKLHDIKYSNTEDAKQISFTVEAETIFENFCNEYLHTKIVNANDESLDSMYSKFRGILARIALVLELLNWASNDYATTDGVDEPKFVTVDALDNAIMLIKYYIMTSEKVHSILRYEQLPDKVLRVFELRMEGCSYREISRKINIATGTISGYTKKYETLFNLIPKK